MHQLTCFEKREKLEFLPLQKVEQKRNCKHCNLCAQQSPCSPFIQHLRGNNHLPKAGDKVRCETCKLAFISGPLNAKSLLRDEHFSQLRGQAQSRSKLGCETSQKKSGENVF